MQSTRSSARRGAESAELHAVVGVPHYASVVPRGNHANSQTTKATLGLRELLLSGAFKPKERVPELRLVEELGVSRTPLRIALMTLEHEGLLETLPGGGFVVREFTRNDIDDAIELRGVLEGTAARLAAERLESEDELAPLRELCEEMDVIVRDHSIEALMDYVEVNQEFHDGFRDLAKSPQLNRALEHVLALPFAPASALLSVHAALPESWEIFLVAQHQHRALIDAIGRREGARAESIGREHARIARRNLDIALENRHLLERVPGSTLLRIPAAR
jgi:GntR family transcriptional regulator of vanillate catabolism